MAEQKETKQMSIYFTPDVWDLVQEQKQIHFDKTYGEVLRMMLTAGAEALRKKESK